MGSLIQESVFDANVANTASINYSKMNGGTSGTMANLSIGNAGAIKAATGSGNTLLLQGYNTNTSSYVTVASITSGPTPSFSITEGSFILTAPLPVTEGGTGLATLTAHSLYVGEGTAVPTALGVASHGQLPIGSTGADPVLATLTGTSNQVIVTNGAGSITLSTPQSIGTGSSPTFAGLTLSSPLTVANGGTGLATLTAHSLYVGEGTSVPVALGVAADGQIPIGSTGADPVLATITGTANRVSVGVGSGSITLSGPQDIATSSSPTFAGLTLSSPLTVANGGTGLATLTAHSLYVGEGTSVPAALGVAGNGQLPIGSVGADPVLAALTGTSNQVIVTNGAGSITLSTPQSIGTGSSPTFAGLTLSSPLTVANGGTGLATLTAHSLYVGEGTSVPAALGVASNGQIPIGSVGADPVLAALTGTANQVIVTNGAGSITLSAPQDIATGSSPTFNGLTLTSALTVANGGTGRQTLTNHGVLVGAATTAITQLGTGSAGQVLQSGGSSADPSYSTPTYPSASGSSGQILRSNGTNNLYTTSTFADTYAASNLLYSDGTNKVIGLATANSGVLVTSATGVPSVLGSMTDGQLIIGSSGNIPVKATLTGTSSQVIVTNGAGSITLSTPQDIATGSSPTFAGLTLSSPLTVANGGTGLATLTAHSLYVGEGTSVPVALGVASNGQIPIGSVGADPVLATLTPGTGISISNSAGSITISSTVGGLVWSTVSGTSQAASVDNAYITNNTGLVTVTLPVTAAVGDGIIVAGKGSGKWLIAQNDGQVIHFNSSDTIVGTGGSLAATNRYNSVELVCITADTDWLVINSQGNLTVV